MTQSQFLVCSQKHLLLPFASRLQNENDNAANVHVLPGWQRRFDKGRGRRGPRYGTRWETAWAGRFEVPVKPSQFKNLEAMLEHLAPVREAAERGEIVVLSDAPEATKFFAGALHLFEARRDKAVAAPKGRLRLGAWRSGSGWEAPHLLFVDEGAWPGGMGEPVDAGLTMMKLTGNAEDLAREMIAAHEANSEHHPLGRFRGLAQWPIDVTRADGRPRLGAPALGWPFLHTHAFIHGLPNLSDVLLEAAPPTIPKRFTTVIPVSVPPWPCASSKIRESVAINGLDTPELRASFFWHDIALTAERKALTTAGLDGLVGVARGSANNATLATAQALDLCQRVSFPAKQFRPDAGGQVYENLAALEVMGLDLGV